MQSIIYSSMLQGIQASRVTIEVSVEKGLGVSITGMADDAIQESYSHISAALKANGFMMPRTKLIVNLAPAGIRKTGASFDLPIALGILKASEQLNDLKKLEDYLIVGELGLDGSIRHVSGALPMALHAKREGFLGILLPAEDAPEASLVDGIDIYPVQHLKQVISFIKCDCALSAFKHMGSCFTPSYPADFSQVKGQQNAKRALEIAAAGGHNALLIGPPETGKTMLAKRLPSILPPMNAQEALETTCIHSIVNHGDTQKGLIAERPFRSPHHTCSPAALAGGGSLPIPGEISLAHNGVLFLDELGEFKRSVIEVLRQPMEERKITIARAKSVLEFPASFTLLAAMNPCFCGHFGHPQRKCTCSAQAIIKYRRRISGPLLERIDLHIEVEPIPLAQLAAEKSVGESSATIRNRVIDARRIQSERYTH